MENEMSPQKFHFGGILLVILVLAAMGGGVWYWQKYVLVKPNPPAGPGGNIPATHDILAIDQSWNEYHDYENHYLFRFPQTVSNVRGCPGDTERKIPLTVLRDGNVSYLKETEVAVWGEQRCETVPLSLQYLGSGPHTFAFKAADAANDEEINAFLMKEFGPGCRVSKKTPDQTDASKIHIAMVQTELCFINYVTNVVWSEEFGKILKWNIGQDYNFIDNEKKDADGFGHIYDGEISVSVRFE